MREYIKIQSSDGNATKTIRKDEYSLYAQGGWKMVKDIKTTPTASTGYPTYGSTTKA